MHSFLQLLYTRYAKWRASFRAPTTVFSTKACISKASCSSLGQCRRTQRAAQKHLLQASFGRDPTGHALRVFRETIRPLLMKEGGATNARTAPTTCPLCGCKHERGQWQPRLEAVRHGGDEERQGRRLPRVVHVYHGALVQRYNQDAHGQCALSRSVRVRRSGLMEGGWSWCICRE